MASWSTLIVAGRIDETLQKEKLSSLLFNCLTTCYGTDVAAQVDADYAGFAAAFAKPTLSNEFGLTNAHSGSSSSHLVRVQYNPTSEHFRAALREALRHALNGARPADTQTSTGGRVNVIYVGQVLGLTGEWLLADSSLSGQLLTSWLDSDAARSWWPQLDKFINQGDRLFVQLITPLAGTGTSWSATKPGHAHRLLTHVDVHLVQLDLAVEGSWRLNGRPVVMDSGTVGTAYDGLRTFAHLSIEQHTTSQFTLPTDGSPLGCALSADRPSLYVFPGGGGVASQASGLFALQGFTMLLNGSFTGHGAPGWWPMVRNLPKLDTVVLPDWSAANVLTNQFVSVSRRLDSAESHVLGDLIAPPPCALAPGEVTGQLAVYAPTSADQPHCFHWSPSTADISPPAITLYFKLGWGELKLQPLSQRAGLLLIWTSALPAVRGSSSLHILYPATQSPGTTATQGLTRLLKALGSMAEQSTNGGGAEPASGKSITHKPTNTKHTSLPSAKPIESSNRLPVTQATRASTTNHIPKPNTESQSQKKPSVPKRPATAKPPSSQETTRPQPAKPQVAARPLPSRPATAPKSTMRPAASTAKSSQPTRNDTTTTASRLAAHASLVASKQTAGKAKAPPANATQRPVAKPAASAHPTSGKVPQHVSPPPASTTERPDQPVHVNESLELAPMDPLITGWRASELSPVGDAAVPETAAVAHAEQEPQGPNFSELYRVHKFEHLNEADEMALDSTNPIPDTGADMPPAKSDSIVESLRHGASSDRLESEHVESHADLVTGASPLPSEPEDLSNQLTKSTVSDVLKLIDPMNDQKASDGEPNLPESQLANDVDEPPETTEPSMEDLDREHSKVCNESLLMSRPPQFIETGMDQEPVGDGGEIMSSRFAELREGLRLSGLGDAAAIELDDAGSSENQVAHDGPEIQDRTASAYAVDHAFDEEIRSYHHEAIEKSPLDSEGFISSQTPEDFAHTGTVANLPTDLVPCADAVDATSPEILGQPVDEPPSDYLVSYELRSRPPLDIGLEDDGLPDVITRTAVLGEQSHYRALADSPDHVVKGQPDLFASDRMDDRMPVDAASADSPVEVQAVEQSSGQLQVQGHIEPDGVPAVEVPHEVSALMLGAVSHDLHVEVDENKDGTENAVPACLAVESGAHPAVPYGFRAQLGSPSSDTSDMELNDREFWVSTTRTQQQQDPSEQQIDPHGSLTDVVINSQDLLESRENQDELSLSPDATTHAIDREPSEIHPQTAPDVEASAVDSSVVEPTDVVRLSADSLEATQDEPHPQQSDEPLESHELHAPVDFVPMDYQSQLPADSTTVGDDGDQYELDKSRPIGFVCASPDQTNDPLNLGSPTSDASVDSVVRTTESGPHISSSNQIEPDASDDVNWPIGFKHLDSSNCHSNGTNGSVLNDEAPTNRLHTENGNHVIEFPPYPTKKGLPFTPSEPGPVPEVHSAGDCVLYPSSLPEDGDGQPPMVACPVVPQASGDSATETAFDPLSAWGQPQGMPAPAPPSKPGSMHKTSTSSNTRYGTTQRPSSGMKSTASAKSASTAGATSPPVTLPPGPPIFLDLIWVPSYLAYVPQNLAVEFFSRVRARVYVISGEALHPTVGEALLAGKAKWSPNDVDSLCRSPDARLTILPTDEPYEWACWLRTPCGREDRETGESRLQASGFHVMPTASLCDIEYSANNVAFRCEGVRVDL